ncbi:transposase [Mesorhizobium sp. M1216]|uniref:transposase n=1 Tax=Mesorhizobium sp. M1216 TaxID=2957069 RepID=UPI003337413B
MNRSSTLSCQLEFSGATATEVAHRHDVTRQQIYTWRSELKKKGLLSRSANAVFVPVDMNALKTERGGNFRTRLGSSSEIDLRSQPLLR